MLLIRHYIRMTSTLVMPSIIPLSLCLCLKHVIGSSTSTMSCSSNAWCLYMPSQHAGCMCLLFVMHMYAVGLCSLCFSIAVTCIFSLCSTRCHKHFSLITDINCSTFSKNICCSLITKVGHKCHS